MFSKCTVREESSKVTDSIYTSRLNKRSNLFDETNPDEDDTVVDDLTLAAEMITYEKPTLKTWKSKKESSLFTDTSSEDEITRVEAL